MDGLHDVTIATDQDSHTDMQSDRDAAWEPVAVDFSDWKLTENCGPPIARGPASEQPFKIPRRPSPTSPALTRSDLVERYGEPLPNLSFIAPDPSHQPDDGFIVDLWANHGDDVKFYVSLAHPLAQDLETHRTHFTLLVNYEPVEARYTRWDQERENVLEDVQRHGAWYPRRTDVEFFDITIPAAAFGRAGVHEISVAYEFTNTSKLRKNGESRRYTLFYGGFSQEPAPCVPEPLNAAATEHEYEFSGYHMSDDTIFISHDGMAPTKNHVIRIEPGATIEFIASHFRMNEVPTPVVAQPLLNGEPVGGSYMTSNGGPGAAPRDIIDARKTFSVTFPEEPGLYEVMVAEWPHGYELTRFPDGTDNPDVTRGRASENSNALRFEILE